MNCAKTGVYFTPSDTNHCYSRHLLQLVNLYQGTCSVSHFDKATRGEGLEYTRIKNKTKKLRYKGEVGADNYYFAIEKLKRVRNGYFGDCGGNGLCGKEGGGGEGRSWEGGGIPALRGWGGSRKKKTKLN